MCEDLGVKGEQMGVMGGKGEQVGDRRWMMGCKWLEKRRGLMGKEKKLGLGLLYWV